MKKTLLAMLSLLLIAALFVGGCNKTTNPTSSNTQPTIPVFQWSVPALDTTQCSATAWGSVVEVQAMTQLTNGFAALPGTNNNGTWTWNIPQNGVTFTLTATTGSNGEYNWNLKANGTDASTSITYTNFTVFEGSTAADGSSGNLTIYDESNPGTPTILGKFSWTISGSTVNATFESYQSGSPYVKVLITSTQSAGGSVTIYPWTGSAYSGTAIYHGTWTTPGGSVTCG